MAAVERKRKSPSAQLPTPTETFERLAEFLRGPVTEVTAQRREPEFLGWGCSGCGSILVKDDLPLYELLNRENGYTELFQTHIAKIHDVQDFARDGPTFIRIVKKGTPAPPPDLRKSPRLK